MVDVSSQSNKVNITVSSSGVSSNVNASGDTSHYYSEKAREWAISNRIVDGVDYSSKYYASKSNQSALNAQSFAQSAQESYNNFQQSVDGALSNIESSVQGAIDEINNTKTDIITDIEFVADGEKKEIEDLIDNGKEDLKEAIGDVKVLTTLKIGQIGIAPLGIDETLNLERYLNGQIIMQDQFKSFTNHIKRRVELYPSVACTESEWQTEVTMSAFSQCGKFVIDDNAGTIRLPKVVNIQGLTDLSKLGEIVEAGLPNITGNTIVNATSDRGNTITNTPSGAFKENSTYCYINGGSNYTFQGRAGDMDASRCSNVYGNSNTVQQEQIQYPYFIQVATGAETEDNIINEIELNNPFSLLDYKYSEYELNNLSWLRSNGQYNAKAIYPAVYDLLLKIYNGTETKAGVSVKLSTGSYTDYDFVLNTSTGTFRLPIKVKLASGKAVAGNGLALGLTDGANNVAISYTSGNPGALRLSNTAYGLPYGDTDKQNFAMNTMGVTTDPTKSGIELSDSGLYLYFYVGETVQNANLINAGRIEEKLADKVDLSNTQWATSACIPDYSAGVVKTWGTSYTADCDGWIYVRGDGGSSEDSNLKINGTNVCILASGFKGMVTGSAFVGKGDIYQASGGGAYYPNSREIIFYPLKGAK